jgi:hypothetical protein
VPIVFNFFLKRGGKIFATVTGNKFFNIGLELLCTYTFLGQAADVEKLRTKTHCFMHANPTDLRGSLPNF